MFKKEPWSGMDIAAVLLACCFVLALHGAVPFLTVPTLGQAIWSMGWAESFSHGALFDFYAHDFGMPAPAPIAFGLAGAWPASLLIRMGLHAGDAYAAIVGAWLMVAMLSAWRIGSVVGVRRPVALLGAVAWMSMPIIWAHAWYSMLSLGIALLPFYFLAAFRLFLIEQESARITPAVIARYVVATVIAVFMDGYTFMMFAVGASIFLLYSLRAQPARRSVLLKIAVPVHLLSFGLAYLLFAAYIGKSTFAAHDIDFFRAWGVDVSFLAAPAKGMLWAGALFGPASGILAMYRSGLLRSPCRSSLSAWPLGGASGAVRPLPAQCSWSPSSGFTWPWDRRSKSTSPSLRRHRPRRKPAR